MAKRFYLAPFYANMVQSKNGAGFTLIELLVVMAIIGILAGLSLTSFNTAQKSSRDTRRKSDLYQYKVTLEAYASNNNGKYPITLPGGPSCDGDGESACQDNVTGAGSFSPVNGIFSIGGPLINEYLPAVILPSLGTPMPDGNPDIYRYFYDTTGTKYTLITGLEAAKGRWQVCSNGKAGFLPNLPDETIYHNANCDL